MIQSSVSFSTKTTSLPSLRLTESQGGRAYWLHVPGKLENTQPLQGLKVRAT